MCGIVYRLGRRQSGSKFVALGVALAFAVNSPAVATAKAHSGSHRPVKASVVVAHAAGHKIA
jgi:hypothetical protein